MAGNFKINHFFNVKFLEPKNIVSKIAIIITINDVNMGYWPWDNLKSNPSIFEIDHKALI